MQAIGLIALVAVVVADCGKPPSKVANPQKLREEAIRDGSVDTRESDDIVEKDVAEVIVSSPSIIPPVPEPSITSQPTNVAISSADTVVLGGQCLAGSMVTVAGDDSQTSKCLEGSYSLTVTKVIDGSYIFLISQTTTVGRQSKPIKFQWIRNTRLPLPPTIDVPVKKLYHSREDMLSIVGSCITGNTVWLSGTINLSDKISPLPNSVSEICKGSTYSFRIQKYLDNNYAISISQTDGINFSQRVSMQWDRDTLAPSPPTVSVPSSNPFISGDSAAVIKGTCETNATLQLSSTGIPNQYITCDNGSYFFKISAPQDGSYDFDITQTDAAGNTSEIKTFHWTRDTSIPPTPILESPDFSPRTSNEPTFIIAGKCISSNEVHLAGTVAASEVLTPSSSLKQTCLNNSFSFTIGKAVSGVFTFSVRQSNAAHSSSARATTVWIRDTVAPASVTKVQPAISPYRSAESLVIAGTCEESALVSISGDFDDTQVCVDGFYSFPVSEGVFGKYKYIIKQMDAAGNVSVPIEQDWIKDFSVPPTPTIAVPAVNPAYSIETSLPISGDCVPGYLVTIGGQVAVNDVIIPARQLTLTCPNSGGYNFTVAKLTDGVYNFNITQNNGDVESGAVAIEWIVDTTAPKITIDSAPASQNLGLNSVFIFNSDDGSAATECQLDAGAFSGCQSPVVYPGLTNSAHTFSVRGRDFAGNIGNPTVYTWTQSGYKTIALYNFDAGSLVDSSNQSGFAANNLVNSGTTVSVGMFSTGARAFQAATLNYLEAAATESQDQLLEAMTIEAFLIPQTLPVDGADMALVSKLGSPNNLGWEFGIRQIGSESKLFFMGSVDGVTTNLVSSVPINLTTGTPMHLAVTWQYGTIHFYCDGFPCGEGTIGNSESGKFYRSTAPLRLGASTENGSYFDGTMDEVRVSQIVRYSGIFTPPSIQYLPD